MFNIERKIIQHGLVPPRFWVSQPLEPPSRRRSTRAATREHWSEVRKERTFNASSSSPLQFKLPQQDLGAFGKGLNLNQKEDPLAQKNAPLGLDCHPH